MSSPIAMAEVKLLNDFNKIGMFPVLSKPIILRAAKPDLYFSNWKLCVYLDGPPHERAGQKRKDEDIREELRSRGYVVMEFEYKPPISDAKREEIVKSVLAKIEELRRRNKIAPVW